MDQARTIDLEVCSRSRTKTAPWPRVSDAHPILGSHLQFARHIEKTINLYMYGKYIAA